LNRLPAQVLPEASTLADTLDPKYDVFFDKLTKFGYKTCLGYFLPSNEVRDAELLKENCGMAVRLQRHFGSLRSAPSV
jgi:hypothetical protein